VVAQRYFQKASFLLLRENSGQILATPIAALLPLRHREGHRNGAVKSGKRALSQEGGHKPEMAGEKSVSL